MTQILEETSLVTTIDVDPSKKDAFVDWQSELNSVIAQFPGFLSFEISSPDQKTWVIVQRFNTHDDVAKWQLSQERKLILDKLDPILLSAICDTTSGAFQHGGITEVFVTRVNHEREKDFKEWLAKVHQVEARFPGFKGMYVQSPTNGGEHWTTLLQFDTAENLDRWIISKERTEVLNESKGLIDTLETHRVISPYAGWFSSVSKGGVAPPLWKQTMIVLLVLFPIVMLEMKFLNPHLTGLNPSLGTFIGNAISVSLVSWPTVPIAIYFLKWWLVPEKESFKISVKGTLIVGAIYLLEIALLWHLLEQLNDVVL